MSNEGIQIGFSNCEVKIDRMFDIHDNQSVQIYANGMDGAANGMDGTTGGKASESTDSELSNPIIAELMPIFMNRADEALAFIRAIDGAKPTLVTEHVNLLLRQGKVTRAGCKGDLWGILNRFGLYRPGVKNWNMQVNA